MELTHVKVADANGIRHSWSPARKDAIGTAYEEGTANSPVWFSVAEGILSEVYYPTIDRPQVGDLQLLVTDGKSFFSEQRRDVRSQVTYADDGLSVRVSGREASGAYTIEQVIVTDPRTAVVRVATRMRLQRPDLRVYVLFKPAAQGRASDDFGRFDKTERAMFAANSASDAEISSALVAQPAFVEGSVGFVGSNDGWQELSRNFRLTHLTERAGPGNLAITGQIPRDGSEELSFDLSLGFGPSRAHALQAARGSLTRPFAYVSGEYSQGWSTYLNDLLPYAGRDAAIIRAHEDKFYPGAVIASLSHPGIPDGDRSLEPLDTRENSGGYHLVWPRDLYHSAMGLLAAGDERAPVRILRYLLARQNADGGWHQNFWVDGAPYWTGIQLDEVAFPILLAAHLKERGLIAMDSATQGALRRAAAYLREQGPFSQQDRWEEIGGAIPSTLAAEIAALRAYTHLSGEPQSLQTAEAWNAQIEKWTRVPSGPLGRDYFLRVSLTGNAALNEFFHIANGGGPAMTQDILDGGFLELVRLGVRSAADPGILNTLMLYLDPARGVSQPATRPGAYLHRRYTRDAYGLDRVGRPWPLLTGESGHYFLALGDRARARASLAALEDQALPSGLIPEQTEGMGVATPLVWAHAEAIRLRRSIQEGRVFDFPPASSSH